jgi:protein gp37
VTLHDDLVDLPRTLRQPRVIFVNAMTDLLHADVPNDFIGRVFETMAACPQHTFQILTKRSRRLRKVAGQRPWSSNVRRGVSVEDSRVLGRIDDLRDGPAAVRFLSCEPLLGPMEDLNLDGINWVIGHRGIRVRPCFPALQRQDDCRRCLIRSTIRDFLGAARLEVVEFKAVARLAEARNHGVGSRATYDHRRSICLRAHALAQGR